MKPSHLPLLVLVTTLLPALALAVPADKAKKRTAARPASDGAAEVLKPFDKNENHQVDADELAAMQKSYAALRKLDKNSNGEIEQAEVDSLKAPATDDRKSRMLAGFSACSPDSKMWTRTAITRLMPTKSKHCKKNSLVAASFRDSTRTATASSNPRKLSA